MKDITIKEAAHLRDQAGQAFRNSIGMKDGDPLRFDHKEFTVMDLNFLWHFKMLIEEEILNHGFPLNPKLAQMHEDKNNTVWIFSGKKWLELK